MWASRARRPDITRYNYTTDYTTGSVTNALHFTSLRSAPLHCASERTGGEREPEEPSTCTHDARASREKRK